MKKALKMLVVSALVATTFSSVALAEVTIGAWGRAVFAPVVSDNQGELSPQQSISWGWGGKAAAARIGFSVKGNSDNVGFQVDMNADGQNLGFQDQQKIWVKPIDILTVEVGPSIFYDALRGNATFGNWNWMRLPNQEDEDAVFLRGKAGKGDGNTLNMRKNGAQDGVAGGTLIHLDTAGIHAFVSWDQSTGDKIGTLTDADGNESDKRETYTTAMMMARGQYGAGYDIAGIGQARLQYIGKAYAAKVSDDELTGYGLINAAVKIDKIMPGLVVDLGFFTATEDAEKTGDFGDHTGGALFASMGLGTITVSATGQMRMDVADTKGSKGTAISSGLGVGVNLGAVALDTDVRYINKNWGGTEDDTVAALVGVVKGFSNGKIGAGFQYSQTYLKGWYNDQQEKADDAMWAIPVVVEYWF